MERNELKLSVYALNSPLVRRANGRTGNVISFSIQKDKQHAARAPKEKYAPKEDRVADLTQFTGADESKHRCYAPSETHPSGAKGSHVAVASQ